MSKKDKTTIKEVKNVDGMLALTFEHEVKSTKYSFRWDGPKIPREEWQKILAFFKWTYDTSKSESQVRLFVNCRPEIRTWRAWAFPQKANGGMSAIELDTPETQAQRAQFSDGDGWTYFGTVHHHCSASAFQSGVDEANEKNQDGLHITVGRMDALAHDIHARFYIGGERLNAVDLSTFWDVGGAISSLPVWIRELLPKDAGEKAAKREMSEPAPADIVFPEQWRNNLIIPPPMPVVHREPVTHAAWNPHSSKFGYKPNLIARASPNLTFDLDRAMEEVLEWMSRMDRKKNSDPATKEEPDWDLEAVTQLACDAAGKLHDEEMELLDILFRNDILPENFVKYTEDKIEKSARKELEQELNGKKPPMTEAEYEALQQAAFENWRGE